jgi:hypothetical protein
MFKRARVIALLVALTLAPSAFAARGGNSNTGAKRSDPTPIMVNDLNGNGLPNWGDTVTFKVSTPAAYPALQLACYQNGALVFAQTAGFFPTYAGSKNFTLQGDRWSGGPADCTATLYTTSSSGKQTTLATTSFHADA